MAAMVGAPVPRAVSAQRYEHGEGMRWDAARRELLWVDIGAGHLMRATPSAIDTPAVADIGRPLGAVAPVASGGWLLAAGRGLGFLAEDGAVTMLRELEPDGNRMNDAACDRQGRFWAGSMAFDETAGAGTLHRFDPDGSVRTMQTGLTISNGVGWSPDSSTMYLNDSGPGVTYAFDFDAASGAIEGRRVLISYSDGVGDGLTVDDEGCLWVALWGGGAVSRYDPEGGEMLRVALPAPQPSCCWFAEGVLYVTTAYKGRSNPAPNEGRIFALDVGVDGPPAHPFAGDPLSLQP